MLQGLTRSRTPPRANLRFFNVDGGLRSLLIASPASGDGKSTVAAGLTRTMAAMGDSVLLIEADLHKPSPTAGEAPGLSSVLAGMLLEDALINVPVPVARMTNRPQAWIALGAQQLPRAVARAVVDHDPLEVVEVLRPDRGRQLGQPASRLVGGGADRHQR